MLITKSGDEGSLEGGIAGEDETDGVIVAGIGVDDQDTDGLETVGWAGSGIGAHALEPSTASNPLATKSLKSSRRLIVNADLIWIISPWQLRQARSLEKSTRAETRQGLACGCR